MILSCPSDSSRVGRMHNYAFCIGDGTTGLNPGYSENNRGVFGQATRFVGISDGRQYDHDERTGPRGLERWRISPARGLSAKLKSFWESPTELPASPCSRISACWLPTAGIIGRAWLSRDVGSLLHRRPGGTHRFYDRSPAKLALLLDRQRPERGQQRRTAASLQPPSRRRQCIVGRRLRQVHTETIDTGNLGLPPTGSGHSPYGVWGAMGSIAGGESIAMP